MPTTINGTSGIDRIKDDTVAAADLKAGEAVGIARVQLLAAKTLTGAFVDFSPADGTGIPSWAKRVTLTYTDASTNGASNKLIRLGTAAGVDVVGYAGATTNIGASALATANPTDGFEFGGTNAADVLQGSVVFTKMSGNIWEAHGHSAFSSGPAQQLYGGKIALASDLTRLRLTTRNGTDLYDGGSASLLIEGYL